MEPWLYFCTTVYNFFLKEYIEDTNKIVDEYLHRTSLDGPLNIVYPAYQTTNFQNDIRISKLHTEIIKKCDLILQNLGYNTSNQELFFVEFWAQQHFKGSGHDRHIHANTILTGFYFLDCPENGCRLVIHDPRPAKEFSNFLPETNISNITHATSTVNFKPESGQLIILNSFIPHGFTRNENDLPSKFIHFTVTSKYKEATII